MSTPVSPDGTGSSTRPYLIRALHEWCTDNGYTPYVAVHVDESVQVPLEYVKNGEIVLNVGFEATSALELGNELISFRARFGGVARDIVVPVDRVVAIYARENGQGMAFPVPAPAREASSPAGASPAPAPVSAPLRLAPAPAAQAPAASGEPPAALSAHEAPDTPERTGAAPGTPTVPGGPQPAGPTPGRRPSLTRVK